MKSQSGGAHAKSVPSTKSVQSLSSTKSVQSLSRRSFIAR
jgi:hypothetical protein